MRKVKLLALLLAALMVVAAFAGCANTEDIENDVADLEDRVEALEGKIDNNADQINALAGLIEELNKSQTSIQNSVNAGQTEQAASNQALLDAINALKNQIADLDKEIDQVAKDQAAAEKEAAEKEAAEKEAAAKAEAEAEKVAAALKVAQDAAAKQIELEYAARVKDSDNYFEEDYANLLKLFASAETKVDAAANAAEVEAAMEQFYAELKGYVAIDDQLYNYFETLWGGMTEANRAVNEAAQELLKAAQAHYAKLLKNEDLNIADVLAVKKYVYGTAKDGSDLIVNLPAMLDVIDDVYNKGSSQDLTFLKANYSALEADVDVYSLAKAVKEAAKIDASIKDFVENKAYEETYVYLMQSAYTIFSDLNVRYETWCLNVLALSEDNIALLTLAEKMEHVKGLVDNYVAAIKALRDLGEYNYTVYDKNAAFENIFLANDYDVILNATTRLFYDDYDANTTKEFATQAIFAPIDAGIAAWAADYKLVDADVKDIIEDVVEIAPGVKVDYEEYLGVKAWAAGMDAKLESFKTTIVPLVQNMNEQDAIEVEAYQAYEDLSAALKAWIGVNPAKELVVDEANYNVIVALTGVIKADKFAANTESFGDPLDLVVFKRPIVRTYGTTIADADVLRTFFAAVAADKVVYVSAIDSTKLAPNYRWMYNTYAAPINAAIEAQQAKFDARKLFSTKDLLALQDEIVELTIPSISRTVYIDRDHTLLALKDNGAYVYNLPGLVNSIALPAGVTTSIHGFKDICVDYGYDGLAGVMTNEEGLEALLEAFDARVAQLEADGATAFRNLIAKVDFVKLYSDAANGALRTANTSYAAAQDAAHPYVMYYVTLAEYTEFVAAQKELQNWIDLKGGNVEYKKMVDFEITTADKNVYTAQVYEYVIGDGNYDKYSNMLGQFTVLNAAIKNLKEHFTILATYAAPEYGTAGLMEKVTFSSKTTTNNNTTTTTYTYFVDYNKGGALADALTLEKLISLGFEKYVEFEKLNAYRGCSVCATKDELAACKAAQTLYVKAYESATWDNIAYFIDVYVKDAIYDAFTAKLSASRDTDKDFLVKMYLGFVKNANTIYGQTEKAIEYSPYNYVATYGEADTFAVTLVELGAYAEAFNANFKNGVVFADDHFVKAGNGEIHG